MAKTTVSKMVEDRTNSSLQVKTAHRDGIDLVAAYFDDQYGAGNGDHVKAVMTPLMAQLETCTDALQLTTQNLVTERNESTAATSERDRLAEACRQTLLSIRSTLFGMYGPEYVGAIGLGSAIPARPESVLSVANYVIERVPKVPVPKTLLLGTSFDFGALTANLVEPTAKLKTAMLTVSEEKRQSDGAQIAKDAALVEFDRSFVVAAGLLSTLLDISGQTERARRVRPSTRRPGNTVDVANEDPDPVNPEPIEPTDPPATPANG